MYQQNTVDVIGADSICKLIRQTKLTKFIVFRGGAQRGSTPVFRATDSRSVDQAIQCFKDWAESILRLNAFNNIPYDLLLYSAKMDDKEIDSSIKRLKKREQDDDDEYENDRTKKDRVRFTFSLNPFNNMQERSAGVSPTDIAGAIEEAFKKRDAIQETERLKLRIAELENQDDDDDEEEDEDPDEENALDKVARLMREVRLSSKKTNVAVAGDDDDDDDEEDDDDGSDDIDDDDDDEEEEVKEDEGEDEDEEEEEKPKAKKELTEKQKKKLDRMKRALKVLWKYDKDLDKDLLMLSKIAEKNPKMFNAYMINLRNMNL